MCDFSRWNLVYVLSGSWDISKSGFVASILSFPLPVYSDIIRTSPIQLLDNVNVTSTNEISLLFHLEANILVFPVWRPSYGQISVAVERWEDLSYMD